MIMELLVAKKGLEGGEGAAHPITAAQPYFIQQLKISLDIFRGP